MKPNFTSWAAAAVTALALSCGAGAQATVLTFDTLPWLPHSSDEPYTEAGYQVWAGYGSAGYPNPYPHHGDVISSGGGVGLNLLYSAFPTHLSVIRADGGPFALLGLDIIETSLGFTITGSSPVLDPDNPQDDVIFEGWRGGAKVAEAAGSAEAAWAMPERRLRLTFDDTFREIDHFLIIGWASPNRVTGEWQSTVGIDNIIVESAAGSAAVSPVPLPATGLALLGGLTVLAGAARTRRARRARSA